MRVAIDVTDTVDSSGDEPMAALAGGSDMTYHEFIHLLNSFHWQGSAMNFERVIFGFFIILALSLSVVFVTGVIDNPAHHSVWILTLAILVNLIATGLKLGDRSQVGALLLASSLVADLLLISARIYWVIVSSDTPAEPGPASMASIVALAGGALLANAIAVVLLIGDTLMSRR